jgi:hypothetical protein
VNSEFVTLIKHQLKSNAQTDNRLGLLDGLEDQIVHSRLAEARRALAKRADPRQYKASGFPYPGRIICHDGFNSYCFESFLDAP